MLSSFDNTVPLFPKNLLLFGAKTGEGKSSTAAQIAFSALSQINPLSKKPCRVLVITNEETRADAYSRVCFMFMGWKYTSLDRLTDEQRNKIEAFQKEMEKTKQLVVIDNAYPGLRQPTSSVEGIEDILSSVYNRKSEFDLIIIDYFQRISSSRNRPSMNVTDVLTRVCNLLDDYRKRLNCPIVVMAQIFPKTRERDSFESRIKERKKILEVATFACEIEPDRENFQTTFYIHKNRLVPSSVDTKISVGYEKDTGRFVDLTPAFQKKALHWRHELPVAVLINGDRNAKDEKDSA